MINAQKAKSKQINTQHANCQSENIVTNRSTICQTLPFMEDVEPKVRKMYDSTTKVIKDCSTPLLIERGV